MHHAPRRPRVFFVYFLYLFFSSTAVRLSSMHRGDVSHVGVKCLCWTAGEFGRCGTVAIPYLSCFSFVRRRDLVQSTCQRAIGQRLDVCASHVSGDISPNENSFVAKNAVQCRSEKHRYSCPQWWSIFAFDEMAACEREIRVDASNPVAWSLYFSAEMRTLLSVY